MTHMRYTCAAMTDKPEPPAHRHHRPTSGGSGPGRPFRPSDLPPDKRAPDEALREGPNPGVPIPADEYERLKEDAIRRRPPDDAPAQEDASTAESPASTQRVGNCIDGFAIGSVCQICRRGAAVSAS